MNIVTSPPLSLYIHIPWCVRKCPYCDFNSHSHRGALPEAAYVQALLADLETELEQVQGRPLTSIFFGGGTPSLFSGAAIAAILDAVTGAISCADELEVTLEANPGTLEQGRFRDFRRAGVNRLSIGVQSFNNRLLSRLGRIHDADQAKTAIASAQEAGFVRFNIDLMYGLPGQNLDEAIADITTALAFHGGHLSHYQLTLEPGTPFALRPPALPDDESLWQMQQSCQALLCQAGFIHYETSAYALPGQESRHNLNYWQFGDYLGIGAGAHGKITRPDGIWRYRKQANPQRYLAQVASRDFIAGQGYIDPVDLVLEFMMNALRMTQGFSVGLFESRTGLAFAHIAEQVGRARSAGLLVQEDDWLKPSSDGQRFLNDLLLMFMSEPPPDGVAHT